jgi:hypothetical protein
MDKREKIENLAIEIAFLSNMDMQWLAEILVQDYTTRADALEAQLNNALFDYSVKGEAPF